MVLGSLAHWSLLAQQELFVFSQRLAVPVSGLRSVLAQVSGFNCRFILTVVRDLDPDNFTPPVLLCAVRPVFHFSFFGDPRRFLRAFLCHFWPLWRRDHHLR